MNKVELKKLLGPLIKQCVKEVIFEEGILSSIILEVVKGTSSQQSLMTETEKTSARTHNPTQIEIDRTEQKRKQ